MESSQFADTFGESRARVSVEGINYDEEAANAAYAEKHNLQSLFSDMAGYLSEKDPQTELEAERVLLEFLSHRKAERDRAALRLQFKDTFEVSLDKGRRFLKMQLGQEAATLHLEQRGRLCKMDDVFDISLEQAEELTEVFYELGRFVVNSAKGSGEQGGYVRVDDRDVYLLSAGRECDEVGNELFNLAMHISMKRESNGMACSRNEKEE